MNIILSSILDYYVKDENGNKIAITLKNSNQILDNIKKYASPFNKVVFVANWPIAHEENDIRTATFIESFKLAGLHFKENILLDDRNMQNANKILKGANLIILYGGKCLCQIDFLKEINFKQQIQNFTGLIIGISAGAMNLCRTVFNFPEEEQFLDEPRVFDGLNYYNEIIIPHFDGKHCKYQFDLDIDVVNDYILPYSNENKLIGIPNDSYIFIKNDKITFFGNIYTIYKGKCTRIN